MQELLQIILLFLKTYTGAERHYKTLLQHTLQLRPWISYNQNLGASALKITGSDYKWEPKNIRTKENMG